ncbi:MAG: prepilin peptidase [bacterium]|nr:prepilin peptidase [bacterium]
MESINELAIGALANWPIWLVSIVLVVAAWIDGAQLRVPNWITFPLIISGWVYASIMYPMLDYGTWYEGLMWSFGGTAVGLALLLPAYAIGGMGAGDVKLMAGIGAWVFIETTVYAFGISAVVGALMAVGMVLYRKSWGKHKAQFFAIANEIMTIRDPEKLAEIAAERKPRMLLLPYGIPIAVGTILYFAFAGMYV